MRIAIALVVAIATTLVIATSASAYSVDLQVGDAWAVPGGICPGPGNDACGNNPSAFAGCRAARVTGTQKTLTGLAVAWKYNHRKEWCWFNHRILSLNIRTWFSNEDSFTDAVDAVVDSKNTWINDLAKCDNTGWTGTLKHCAHRSWRKGKVKNEIPVWGTVQTDYPKLHMEVNGRGNVNSAGGSL